MGVGKWELNGELQESLGTPYQLPPESMVSGQRMVDLQWELGNGKRESPAAGSLMQLRVYDGD